MRRGIRHGFSLIELMMVIAIIAVLASVAVPRYQIYVQRSHVNASLATARSVQLAVTEYLSRYAELPPNARTLVPYGVSLEGREHQSDLVASVRYDGGDEPQIRIQYRDNAEVPAVLRGKVLALTTLLNPHGALSLTVSKQSTITEQLRPRL